MEDTQKQQPQQPQQQQDDNRDEILDNIKHTRSETKAARKKATKKYAQKAATYRKRGAYAKSIEALKKLRTKHASLDKRYSFKRDEYGSITRYNLA
jgi:ribosomal protein L17